MAFADHALDDAAIAHAQRRTLRTVMAAQVLGGAGLAAGATVGALIAAQLLGGALLAGLPTALLTLGTAATAHLVGRTARRLGRRPALAGGFLAGGSGAAGVVVATAIQNVPLLFLALFVYGAGSATNLQSRYAGTDLALPERRGHAASAALVWTTVGAVAGPTLVTPLGHVATALGLPELTGMFLLAAIAYTGAGLALLVLLRPDPLLLSRRLEEHRATAGTGDASPVTALPPEQGRRLVVLGAATMTTTQLTMVAVMTMTPVAMRGHGHGLTAVGLVIGAHIAAMYLPSPVSGRLADRWGRIPTILAAAVVLLAAGTVAALPLGTSMVGVTAALVLLGFGWNLGLIGGTALVVDGTTPAQRAQLQGTIDVFVALAGAVAGIGSGLVAAAFGYPALTLACGVIALGLVPVAVWVRRGAESDRAPA